MSDLLAERRHAIAVHEAGHTVVAMALGVPVTSVTIVRAGYSGGRTNYDPINLPETDGIIATGGHASTERWKVRESSQVHEKLPLKWPGPTPIPTRNDHKKLRRYAHELGKNPEGDTHYWINGRLTLADDILMRYWAAVEELVPILFAKVTLSGEEVTPIWEPHSPKLGATTEADRAVENSDKTDD